MLVRAYEKTPVAPATPAAAATAAAATAAAASSTPKKLRAKRDALIGAAAAKQAPRSRRKQKKAAPPPPPRPLLASLNTSSWESQENAMFSPTPSYIVEYAQHPSSLPNIPSVVQSVDTTMNNLLHSLAAVDPAWNELGTNGNTNTANANSATPTTTYDTLMTPQRLDIEDTSHAYEAAFSSVADDPAAQPQ